MDKKTLDLVSTLANCQAMCNYCFNACLHEKDIHMMVKCIKLDKECSQICGTAISSIASDSYMYKEVLKLCVIACEKCAEECKKHNNSHCQDCAKACEECAKACSAYN